MPKDIMIFSTIKEQFLVMLFMAHFQSVCTHCFTSMYSMHITSIKCLYEPDSVFGSRDKSLSKKIIIITKPKTNKKNWNANFIYCMI